MMALNKKYTALWIVWLLGFAAIEGSALLNPGDGDTLTETIRKWLALSSRDQWIGRGALAVFLAWLCHHFMYPKKEK
jgi:hypothetical protein